ncbi:hypothetical protein HPB51_007462 [Rhipicephalus microplus]|uniref:Uncharacterized protein n=1 Tax=Rhipicephalus microplus TaxID=6941 RepID=A0A9J6E0U4_RHIMP|nr:hypothetical protein HPB51_007462 [Rhipicephalus microplus]
MRDTTPDLTFVLNVVEVQWSNLNVDLGSDHYLFITVLLVGQTRARSHASTLPIPARLIDDSMDNLDRELPLIPNWSPGDTLTFESTRRLVFVPCGTHIALSLCTEDEVSVAKRSNLAPGQSCGLVNRMALVLKTNPERYFHARIIRTLSEAGLVTPHRRHLRRNTEDEDVEEDSDQSSVRLFFFVYLAGSALSLATLACELFWHKHKKTRGVYVRRAGTRNYAVAPRRIMLRQWRLRTP